MLLELIIALHLKIIFSEHINFDCNSIFNVNGCYTTNKEIYLSYNAEDLNWTLYHEIGHALFEDDKEIIRMFESQKLPKLFNDSIIGNDSFADYSSYNKKAYPTREMQTDEHIANYYAYYKLNRKNFRIYYPKIFKYFVEKENIILSE